MGCAKEEGVTEIQQIPSQENEPQRIIKNRILHFVEKIKSVKYPIQSRENTPPLSLEETVWGIEAVLGVYYSQADDKFDDLAAFKTTVTIPINNGNVADSDLYGVYHNVWNLMKTHLQAVNWSDKKLKYLDLKIDTIIDDEAYITMESKIGRKVQTVLGTPPYFDDSTDDVMAGAKEDLPWAQIPCDTGDATELLEDALNTHYRNDHPLQICFGWVVGWADVEEYDKGSLPINPDDDILFDNIRDYSIWATVSWNPNFYEAFCVPWEDLNLYYDGLSDDISEGFNTNQEFIEVIDLWAHGTYSNNPPNTGIYYHTIRRYKVGTPIIVFWSSDDAFTSWGSGDLDDALEAVKQEITP